MPLKLEIKKQLQTRSDRVKSLDFHPTEPFLLISLYNGQCLIYNTQNNSLIKSFEVSPDSPARTAKFISRKNQFIVGSDDLFLRVYNYNTLEKTTQFEAHVDYIRCVVVHPTLPLVLSCADDMLIKMWDWEKGWKCVCVYEGHTHYVMSLCINPKDTNTFASASLDKSIKIWSLNSKDCNYTLEGHTKGVNWVDYYSGLDKPYVVSGADDKTIRVWDYQNKSCVACLDGHSANVCFSVFHSLPVIISGSEDGSVKLWNSSTWRLENTLNYGLERVWAVCIKQNLIALGYDEGCVVLRVGKEDPLVSMDTSSGKVIYAKNYNEIIGGTINTQEIGNNGVILLNAAKELGNCEVFPAQLLQHSPNGRFCVVCGGDGEYVIYTSLSWRNKSFGHALEFVWSSDNEYAVRESGRVVCFKGFKEKCVIKTSAASSLGESTLFGGCLLGLKDSANSICFYDWNNGVFIRRIEGNVKQVYWSEKSVAICMEDGFYVLKYNQSAVDLFLSQPTGECEDAFEVVADISDSVKQGVWVGDGCFIYISANNNRLNYLVGSQVNLIAHFDSPKYLLGYLAKESKVIVCDKEFNFYAYSLSLTVLEFQTSILRRDIDACKKLLSVMNEQEKNKVARFLEQFGEKEFAFEVSCDIEHKFELGLQLKKVQECFEIAMEMNQELKWKQVGDFALQEWNIDLAKQCFVNAKDYESLFLCCYCLGESLDFGKVFKEEGKLNMAFLAELFQNKGAALDVLVESGRIEEAALFARTYLPSKASFCVGKWRDERKGKFAEVLADPCEYENLFPGIKSGLMRELGKIVDDEDGLPSVTELVQMVLKEKVEKEKEYVDAPSFKEFIKETNDAPSFQQPFFNEKNDALFNVNGDEKVEEVKESRSVNFSPEVKTEIKTEDKFEDKSVRLLEEESNYSMEVNTTGTGSVKGDEMGSISGEVSLTGDPELDEILNM